MPDLTPLFHKVKDALEESGLTMTDRYIGAATFIYHHIPHKILAAFIDGPGVPPTGPDTSGDCHEPEVPNPPLLSGKAAEGRSPSAASTRKGK